MNARGYSLLEVMIVLAIAAVVMLAAAPAISSTVERMTLRSDVRSVTTELRRLRDAALDRQADVILTVGGNGALVASDGTIIPLAAGTVVQIVPASAATKPARLVIAWNGAISGGLRLARGQSVASIAAEPLTGRLLTQGER